MSPDQRRLATCCEDGTIRLHDLAAGTSIALRDFEHSCCWAQFTADGRTLAAASFDGTVRAWSMDGYEKWMMRPGANAPTSFHLDPGGRRMLTGAGDGTVRSWLVEDADVLAVADARCLRDLSAAERLTYADLLGLEDEAPARSGDAVGERREGR